MAMEIKAPDALSVITPAPKPNRSRGRPPRCRARTRQRIALHRLPDSPKAVLTCESESARARALHETPRNHLERANMFAPSAAGVEVPERSPASCLKIRMRRASELLRTWQIVFAAPNASGCA